MAVWESAAARPAVGGGDCVWERRDLGVGGAKDGGKGQGEGEGEDAVGCFWGEVAAARAVGTYCIAWDKIASKFVVQAQASDRHSSNAQLRSQRLIGLLDRLDWRNFDGRNHIYSLAALGQG